MTIGATERAGAVLDCKIILAMRRTRPPKNTTHYNNMCVVVQYQQHLIQTLRFVTINII